MDYRAARVRTLKKMGRATPSVQPGVVDNRNPILEEAMRILGLVQRCGFGIPAVRRELCDNVQGEPEFRIQPNGAQCTVKANGRNPPDLRGSLRWK